MASHELARMKKMDAYIASARQQQHHGMSDVPPEEDEVDRPKMRRGAGPAGQKDQVGSLTLADSIRWRSLPE
jgi:hypothetical protein